MKYILLFVLFLLPIFARAEVIISEVAWMGSENSQFEEWIELQNTGSESVSLSGWKIYEAGGSTTLFSLSGNISAGEYLLVCRTTASITSPLSGTCDLNGAFGGSGLSNSGEHLVLKDGVPSTIQNLDFTGGPGNWKGFGNATTKETMQWNGSIWITASPTPGAQNASFDSGSTGNQGTDGGDDQEADDDDGDEDDDDNSSSSNSSTTSKKSTPTYTKKIVEIKVVDTSVPVGSPVKFSLNTRDLKGANIRRGHFAWNMGDGTERLFYENKKFEHIYDHTGTYTVFLRYYPTYFEGIEPEIVDKITVDITEGGVSISKIHLDGSVEIKNNSNQELDISGWRLQDSVGKSFTIPEGTYLAGGKNLVLNSKRIRLNTSRVALYAPSGSFVGYKEKFPSVAQTASVGSRSSSAGASSSNSSSSNISEEENLNEEDETLNLNEKLNQNSNQKQKQSSVWIIVFVVMLVGVCALVFFLYKSKEEKEVMEEDEFDLID